MVTPMFPPRHPRQKPEPIDQVALAKAIASVLCIIGTVAAFLGRFKTFNDTEMQALINGWLFWTITGLCWGIAAIIWPRRP